MTRERYRRHSRWTDPGPHAGRLADLPADPVVLTGILGGLVVHPAVTRPFGIDMPEEAASDRTLRSVERLLDTLLARDPRPLTEARPPERRLLAICRDFAVLTVAACRQAGVAARVRVGLADYFTAGFLEDHWVAEIWTEAGWRLIDTQLDAAQRAHFAVDFDPADVPRDRFLVAADAWRLWRGGQVAGDAIGVSFLGIRGAWFLAGSLLRDAAALDCDEVLPFDYWEPAHRAERDRRIDPDLMARLDALADSLAEDPGSAAAAHPWAARPPTIVSYPTEAGPVSLTL